MFIRLQYNVNTGKYSIPTATDGTRFTIPLDHPSASHMIAIGPGQTVIPEYNGTVYSLAARYAALYYGRSDISTSYWIKI